jgi:hypothetical protein
VTHFETLVTLLAGVAGLLGGLIAVVWRARGYVDRLNTTDSELAKAISELANASVQMHRENQARFRVIERKLRI